MLTGAADDNTDTASAGIFLRRVDLPLYDSIGPPPEPEPVFVTGTTHPLITSCWEVVGWITPSGGQPIIISSLENSPHGNELKTKQGLLSVDTGTNDQWHEYGLVFTMSGLELQRDGELIADKALATINPTLADTGAAKLTVHLGHAIIGAAFGGDNTTDMKLDPKAAIDDVALFRIGVEKPTRLPPGVEFKNGTAAPTLLIQPNGSLGTTAQIGGIPLDLTWQVRGVFAEKEDTAEITINPTSGIVSSSKLILSPNL